MINPDSTDPREFDPYNNSQSAVIKGDLKKPLTSDEKERLSMYRKTLMVTFGVTEDKLDECLRIWGQVRIMVWLEKSKQMTHFLFSKY